MFVIYLMKANLITQPTRHNLRYANPVKRLRPFQIPTKEAALPSLETPSQGHLGSASGHYHCYSFPQYSTGRSGFVRDREGAPVLWI